MKLITLSVLFLTTSLVMADVSELSDSKKSSSATTKLDPVLRKALLKALSNLESNSETTEEEDNTTDEVTPETTSVKEILEESTHRQKQQVHVHSFVIDASNQTELNADDSGEEIIKTIIIKKPRTTLTPPYRNSPISNFNVPDPLREPGNDIEIDSVQVARSVATSVSANEISSEESGEKRVRTTTAPTTTTSTTPQPPAPVTDADGANIEKVKPEDVKIYQAPLVAAFTVEQDERGTPKQVISLFKNSNDVKLKPAKPVMSFRNEPLAVATTVRPTTEFSTSSKADFSTSSVVFTTQSPDLTNDSLFALEQKNRQLEEHIALLQAQQRQQQEYLRQQQFFAHQQQLFAEQQRLQQQQFEARNNLVQLVPSVPLQPQNVPVSVQQALPIKDASDFSRTDTFFGANQPSFSRFNFQQFPQSSSSVTIQKSKEQEVRPTFFQSQKISQNLQAPPANQPQKSFSSSFGSFIPSPSLNLVAPAISDNRDVSKNRVFRNDAGQTGNFGFNNQVQIQQSVPLNFRPSQSFNGVPNFAGEQSIQNLLMRSGVSFSPRSAEEDFNIISKVLALNHGIQPTQTNNLGLGFNERRFR